MNPEQLGFDFDEEEPYVVATAPSGSGGLGLLYVCLGAGRVFKIGRTGTTRGLKRRLADHRKLDPDMRVICWHIVDEVVQQEKSLKITLADYVVAGEEWIRLDAYSASTAIHFMNHLGADVTLMEVEFSTAIKGEAWWERRP